MLGLSCDIIADSINTATGNRLTTYYWEYPRWFHQEVLTHCGCARNSASSRAIPTAFIAGQVESSPCVPWHIGVNQAGMQAAEELQGKEREEFLADWLALREPALAFAAKWGKKVHKQIVNRPLETWMRIGVVISATEDIWGNLFALRNHHAAEPHFRDLAALACERYFKNEANCRQVEPGGWHLPYVSDEEWEQLGGAGLLDRDVALVSSARCGRVSYFRQGRLETKKWEEDLERGAAFADSGHWSPLEHPAVAQSAGATARGKFKGFTQLRKLYPYQSECIPLGLNWRGYNNGINADWEDWVYSVDGLEKE